MRTERKRGQFFPFRVDLNESDVVAGVGADEARAKTRLVAERDLNRLRALHDVIVCEDMPGGVDYEPRARALHRNGVIEEVVLDRARHDVCYGGRGLLIDAHVFGFERVESPIARRRRSGVAQRFDRIRNARPPTRSRPVGAEYENQPNSDETDSLPKISIHGHFEGSP